MRLRLLVIPILICLVEVLGAAQAKLMCDVECGPDPTVTGYTTVVTSRTAVINQRTGSQPLHIVSKLPFMVRSLQASQSYDYSVNLLSLRGRNGLDVNLSLIYNSRIWSRSSSGLALNADLDDPSYGFRGVDFGFIQKNSSSSDYILTSKNGAKSELFSISGTSLYQSHDSTYLQFDSSTNILVAKEGVQTFYIPFADGTVLPPTKIENTNGNFITLNYLDGTDLCLSSMVDTLGRTISFSYNPSGKLASISQGTKTIAFTWNTAYVLNYNFSLPVVGSVASGSTQTVLTGVTFADGTGVSFLYGDWGIVNRIERHSTSGALRGYVSYNFPAASAGALNDSPGFTQQTMSDGVNTAIWNYGVTKNSSGLVTSFAITDPSQVTTTTTFSANGDWQDGLPLGEQITDSGGKVWRKTIRTWTADNTATGVNPHLGSVVTQSDDGTQSQISYAYDANGNITDVKEYDFAAGAPGPLLRETVTNFAPLGNHILNRPSQILIKDGAGNIIARTDFAYDQYSSFPLKPLSPAAVQHDDVNYSTTPTAARGNLTTKTVYSNAAAGTGAIASTFTYDIAGNKIAAQTGCCTQASSTFSSLTQYAFPDSVIIGPSGSQLTASFTYNFNTGTVATGTDANGQVTSFTYDVDDRTTSVHTPDGITTTTAFDDVSASPGTTSSNSADSQVVKVTKDFAGRVLSQQLLNGTALVSTVSSTHDVLGRLLQISNPYGPSDAASYTTYSYDPLGREVQATAPALVNGTAQASSQTTYTGHITLHTDPAGRQRREYRNALGQITQVDEPGNPFPGTASQGSLPISVLRGSVTVSITGADRSIIAPDAPFPCGTSCPKIYDSGDACITINGINYCGGYAQGMNATAALMASAISISVNSGNGNPYVTATPSGSSVILAARSGVTISSIPISFGAASDDPTDFPTGSYHGTVAAPVYDSGTVSVSVSGFTGAAVSYGSTSGNTTAQQ
ncbi:MAG TPA: hypothetical protein VJN64_07095, partial [Terriglobales bacterium]|nr:hypothetical protein [Terriglobales bacterium]